MRLAFALHAAMVAAPMNRFEACPWAEANRCSWRADSSRRVTFSRARVGWCEFSARLFNLLCCRCSTFSPSSLFAAA